MKLISVLVFIVSLVNATVQASTIDPKILLLPITTISGETITLAEYVGKKPIYLKFWASWCQTCLEQMPHFQHVQKKYGQKIKVIAVNLGVNDTKKSVDAVKQKYGLTMSIAVDTSAELAQAFNLIGTPYHVLIDRQGTLVHTGFKASKALDKKFDLVIAKQSTKIVEVALSSTSAVVPNYISKSISEKPTVLFFVATWCDWYLKDSRSAMSQQCVTAQKMVNSLYKQFPQYNWMGIVSRLWTGEKELADYKKKYNINHPISIDKTNEVFFAYTVKTFPTLIVFNKGKQVLRINEFTNQQKIIKKLKYYSRH